jgi:hypothetical protein
VPPADRFWTKAQQNLNNAAVKRALGLLPEEGETEPRSAEPHTVGQCGTDPETGVPAGVDDDDERIGGFKINRQDGQVIQAEVVPAPVPKRPALPPHQPESNIKIARNASFFGDWKLP